MIKVDTHAHVFSHACPILSNARYKPQYEAVLEDWLSEWMRAGVTHGVLVQPSFLGTDNRFMLEQIARGPGKLRGVIVVDSSVSPAALAEADAAGVRGVRLNLIGVTDFSEFAEERWQTLFRKLVALGWHVEVQCPGEHWGRLIAAFGDTPVTLVVDHFGLPDPAAQGRCEGFDAIMRLAEKRPVYAKLSAPYRLRGADPKHYAARYLAGLGADRLLWGSDWPWTNHEQGRDYLVCADWLSDWIPSEESRQTILHSTPFQLYRF